MTLTTEYDAIEARFDTQWAGATPVGYSGQEFTPTAAGNSVRLTVMSGGADQMSAGDPGNNVVRHVGLIVIEIFVPGGDGEVAVRPLADNAMDIFRNQIFGGVRCRVPYVSAHREEPPFLIWNVICPFERDEFNG
ncbi:MAG: DUF4128 domain-containing protein [Hyphomicrobiales bacterium]|nr:DUF4128 domain-containing protein [Hyphomicrobiales bacterium]